MATSANELPTAYELGQHGVIHLVPATYHMSDNATFHVLQQSAMLKADFLPTINSMIDFVQSKDADAVRLHAFAMRVKALVTINEFVNGATLAHDLEIVARAKSIEFLAASPPRMDVAPVGYPWADGWEDSD